MPDNSWRSGNVGRLMNDAVKLFEQRVIDRMHEKGFRDLSAAHINLTRHLDESGNRLTELAERAAMTKQSMRELVEQVERAGLVQGTPDPTDGRAKIIVFTPEGLRWLQAFGESVQAAEQGMSEVLGQGEVDNIRRALARYVAALDAQAAGGADPAADGLTE